MFTDKNILLVISGGIAAYKSLALIRLIKKAGGRVSCILTKGGEQFVTPLSVAALSEAPVYTDLFSLKDETEMGHIRLAREADAIVAAPASANMIARLAGGFAQDLASTCLLAADSPIMIAPAMNPVMWNNPAVQDNISTLKRRGMHIMPPASGDMACGETGEGRLPEAEDLFAEIERFFFAPKPLNGKHALVTAGPTYEPIDPVRFIGNHSSGKQGYAIAHALRQAGATVTLISGPTALQTPHGVERIDIQSAEDMLSAAESALPADIAICSAAVADWTPVHIADSKIKKQASGEIPALNLRENPDILQTLANHKKRPRIVIGFAAETNDLIANAQAKIKKKNCDYICANDVSGAQVFGAEDNHVHLISARGVAEWPRMSKDGVAQKITDLIIEELG